jgi:hypothetical protein
MQVIGAFGYESLALGIELLHALYRRRDATHLGTPHECINLGGVGLYRRGCGVELIHEVLAIPKGKGDAIMCLLGLWLIAERELPETALDEFEGGLEGILLGTQLGQRCSKGLSTLYLPICQQTTIVGLQGHELSLLLGRRCRMSLMLLGNAIVMKPIGWHGFDGDDLAPTSRMRLIELLHIVVLMLGDNIDARLDDARQMVGKAYLSVGAIEVEVGFELFAEVERILEDLGTGGDMHFLEVHFDERSLFDALYAWGDGDDTIRDGRLYIGLLHSFFFFVANIAYFS